MTFSQMLRKALLTALNMSALAALLVFNHSPEAIGELDFEPPVGSLTMDPTPQATLSALTEHPECKGTAYNVKDLYFDRVLVMDSKFNAFVISFAQAENMVKQDKDSILVIGNCGKGVQL